MTRRSRRVGGWRRAVVLCAGFAAIWLGPLAPAGFAHAELVRTIPAGGQRLDAAPREVLLEFNEQVQPTRDGIRLLDAQGREIRTSPRAAGHTVVLPLPAKLAPGAYVVSWRVISGDTHPVSGAFTFGVGVDPVTTPGTSQSNVSAAATALAVCRWIGYSGTALLLGGVVFLTACWPAGRGLPRARRLVLGGWVAALVAAAVSLLVHGPYAAGRPLSSVVDPRLLADTAGSRFGIGYLARLALLLALVWPVRAVLRPGARRAAVVAAGLLATGLVATHAIAGHAAVGERRVLAMVSDGAHLAAAGLWAGGLVMLAACALPPRAPALGDAPARFSRLAVGAAAVLAATGAFQAWREVGSLAALAGTSYGRLILAKIAVFAGLLGLGGLAWLAVRRSRETALRRIVPVEIACLAVVLGITAVLVATPPQAATPTPELAIPLPDGGSASVQVTPAAVGANEFRVVIHDPDHRVRAVPEVTARVSLPGRDLGPFEIRLRGDPQGGHVGQVTLPFPGTWRLDLTVRTSDVDAHLVTSDFRVGVAKHP
ncbi:copper resistance CopC/CopD family protein [Carbonactinospora thermoautotrophica]|uniref:copper resistance CopC/CopD family protein n=1 Tax=Carbonactinospora thermoautotrophica TaxID=1469144 RepID=UPI003DA8911D